MAVSGESGSPSPCSSAPSNSAGPGPFRARLRLSTGPAELPATRLGSPGLIGEVGIFIAEADSRQGDMGWWLHPDRRRHGYATEAATRLIEWCFAEHRLHRITASCLSANAASRATMDRTGMRLESQSIESRFCAGRWHDEVGYALLERKWVNIER
jgi:RimJ/RimL family protein N-acetyltransferase